MNDSYITGSSIISALGSDKQSAIKQMKSLENSNYDDYRKKVFQKNKFYSIKDSDDKITRFHKIIEQAIFSALSDANISQDEFQDLSVFIGSTSMNISVTEQNYAQDGRLGVIGNGAISDYIDTLLNSKKPSIIFSTACTSSANALVFASNEIKNNNIKKALVLGIEFYNNATYGGFGSLMLLSDSAEYKPLHKDSDGIILGEAVSAVVLENKPKNNTKDKNDFAILGSQNLFDSYSETSSNPNGEIIAQTMKNALENSNLRLSDISLINAHSPGTQTSNEAEYNALDKVLKTDKFLGKITSIKPFIGHTLGACSLNELVLLTSCIQDGFIPNTLGTEDIDENRFSRFTKIDDKKNTNILFSYNGFSGNNLSFVVSNQNKRETI